MSRQRVTTSMGPNLPDGCLTDRKSTRLNSSHLVISYAVFCLKKLCDSQSEDSPQLGGITGAGVGNRLQHLAHAVGFFFFLNGGRPRNSPLFPAPALS